MKLTPILPLKLFVRQAVYRDTAEPRIIRFLPKNRAIRVYFMRCPATLFARIKLIHAAAAGVVDLAHRAAAR